MRAKKIAHPEWIEDACERLRNTLVVYLRDPLPESVAAFCLATPAHRLLRAIYGNSWRVALACVALALEDTLHRLEPLWLMEWRYRRLYGVEPSLEAMAAEHEGEDDAP